MVRGLGLKLKHAFVALHKRFSPIIKPGIEIAKGVLTENAKQGDENAKRILSKVDKAKQVAKLGKEIIKR